MDSDGYVDFVQSTGNKWRVLRKNPIHLKDVFWQHDNARCHVSAVTTQYFAKRGITLVKQSPYSPDLNLCDRWLNCALKDSLRGTKFLSDEEVTEAALRFLRQQPIDVMKEQVNKLYRHCKRVIEEHGIYITD